MNDVKYTEDGALKQCPKCESLNVGAVGGGCSKDGMGLADCQDCGFTIKTRGPMQAAIDIWNDLPRMQSKPTHYAVIDEHGEISHAVRIKSFTDAKQDCERYKGLMCNITPQAKDWTVKGVTVHE